MDKLQLSAKKCSGESTFFFKKIPDFILNKKSDINYIIKNIKV